MGHLTNLIQDFHHYFPDMEEKSAQLDWEKLLEVSSDRGFQMKFSTSTLTQFWVFVKQEHPYLRQKALEQLLPFASTYLCESDSAWRRA
ncbi:protein FAM200A-like [Entelurus aequoreus]|uniref:protein FAM200A-like n=1 Tax=Entelurus aequoreus TaxID=161455 RepID=UPI002B1E39FC|nr:protein FAM200A-like [Entelurus aequoreus]